MACFSFQNEKNMVKNTPPPRHNILGRRRGFRGTTQVDENSSNFISPLSVGIRPHWLAGAHAAARKKNFTAGIAA